MTEKAKGNRRESQWEDGLRYPDRHAVSQNIARFPLLEDKLYAGNEKNDGQCRGNGAAE